MAFAGADACCRGAGCEGASGHERVDLSALSCCADNDCAQIAPETAQGYVVTIAPGTFTYSYERGTLSYDGTTLTYTRIFEYKAGTVQVRATPLIAAGGELQVSLNNSGGSTVTPCVLQVKFDGLHIFDATV